MKRSRKSFFSLALACGLVAAAGAASAAQPAAAPTAAVTTAATNPAKPAAAIFGLYSWGGFGLGARVEWPVLENAIKDLQFKNDVVAVGGIEYYTESFSAFGSYRWNWMRIDAGAMWNFWLAQKVAVYPKLTLGYDVAWLSGWDNAWGPSPSSGGLAFEGAVGVIYNLTPMFQLRGEIGNGSIKAGIGITL